MTWNDLKKCKRSSLRSQCWMKLFSVLLKRCETSYFIEMWVYVLTVIRLCRKLCYWSLFCSMPGPVQVCSTCHVSAFFTRVQYFLCRWVASRLLFLCPTKLFVLSKKMKIMIADTCFFSWKKACVVVVTDLTGWS